MANKAYSKKRTDVLSKKAAEQFVNENVENIQIEKHHLKGNRYTLLKSNKSDEYYVARIDKKYGFFSEEPTYVVDLVVTTPVKPVTLNGNFVMNVHNGFMGLDLAVEDNEEMRLMHFNDDLYNFKTAEDRAQFETFCYDLCGTKRKFDSLENLGEYFSDPNFVAMAKDNVFYYIFKLSDDDSLVHKNIREQMANRQIDKYVKKFTGGQPEDGGKTF